MKDGTYVRNKETGKLELHFSKEAYQALPSDVRSEIKRYFLFSRRASAWVSKAKNNLWYPERIAQRAGLEDAGEVGQAMSTAERLEQEAERAAARAERMEARAEKARQQADDQRKRSDQISERFWGGQPILVGHHSENRMRRDQARMHDLMRGSLQAGRKAEHYDRRAEAAQRTAEQAHLEDPAYLQRRIEEWSKVVRTLQRQADEAPFPDTGERLEQARDRLAFYQERLEEAGGIPWDKERLQAIEATHVRYRGRWYPIKRLNSKTVTISHWLDVATMTWRAPYAEIRNAKRDCDNADA